MNNSITENDERPDMPAAEDKGGDWSAQKSLKIDRLLHTIETKLEEAEFKASVGDFIRLLQLRKELEEERPREITVQWVEPSEEEDAPAT